MIELIINGARGRMGQRIAALAQADQRFHILARIDATEADPEVNVHARHAVIVDFSTPDGAMRAARMAVRDAIPIIVGTTALSAENVRVLDDAARSTAVMIAPNMSLGVAVVNHLAAQCAALLGGAFSCRIVDTHHAGKRDAPSGTALKLARTVRDHLPPESPDPDVRSIREGEVVGAHQISFASPLEIVEISHSAVTRDLFAHGALHAAAWIAGRRPGKYAIEHALNLA